MTEILLRRDKSGKSSIGTRFYGPAIDAQGIEINIVLFPEFVDAKIREVQDSGQVISVTRQVARVQLVPGATYLLSWRMLGDQDASVEYLLGQYDAHGSVTFSSKFKDKIPAPGPNPGSSKQEQSGLLWHNFGQIQG
ncbi:MAG: hypothetical protein ABL914_08430 [Novosphingobium sp.]|uniref:hypothetical protein n=1 Tax=Novosphingobium sp. TaxID=1874826 RepID=UPI0032BCCF12